MLDDVEKNFYWTNTLAYFTLPSITRKKSFIAQAVGFPGNNKGIERKNFELKCFQHHFNIFNAMLINTIKSRIVLPVVHLP